jgi:3-oxoacyl-[acyl-carrier-protein] synthase III
MSSFGPTVGVSIAGLGISLPAAHVASTYFDMMLDLPQGWIGRHCGVQSRHVAGPDETQEVMAAAAAREALADAGIVASDVDLLLFAASVGRQPIPATAALIKRELGLEPTGFPAFDINATCLSALVAMDVASLHIQAGRAKTVLVVASEIASRALPWKTDPRTAGLFGDGAAAIVLQGNGGQGHRLGAFSMETWAGGYEHCTLRSGGTAIDFQSDPERFAAGSFFAMDGPALYKLSAEKAPGFIDRLLLKAGWTHSDVDLVVPHQASPHALAHLAKRCGFSKDRVVDFVAEYGNQVAASLPIALYRARAEGRLQKGMKVMLIGTSAGISLGGATIVW